MVKSYTEFLNENNYPRGNGDGNWDKKNGRGRKSDKESEEEEESYGVWNAIPSYKDIDKTGTYKKIISFVVIVLLFFITLLLTTIDFVASISASAVVGVSFALVFRKQIFSLQGIFKLGEFNPFKNYVFWQTNFDKKEYDDEEFTKSVLYCTNRLDLITTGISVIKVQTMSEKGEPSMLSFIKGLYVTRTPYTYQIIHKPLQIYDNTNNKTNATYQTVILFSTYYKVSGRITKSKMEKMGEELFKSVSTLKSNITSNLHHFKTSLLTGQELVESFRSTVLKRDLPLKADSKKITCAPSKRKLTTSILKAAYLTGLIIVLDVSMLVFNLAFLYRFLLSVGLGLTILLVWWRELFFQLIKGSLFGSEEIEVIDPFTDIEFYKSRKAPETIFYQIEGKTTGGIKIANLDFCSPPPYCKPSKFYEAITKDGGPFTVSFQSRPLNFKDFDEEGFNFLTEKQKFLLMRYGNSPVSRNIWLDDQAGIWSVIGTYSTSVVSNSPSLNSETLESIEVKLKRQMVVLHTAFESNFSRYRLRPLRGNLLESGFLLETLKNRFFRENGIHLNYLLFRGKTLVELTDIDKHFKKGMETRIAAEFNTPLQLTNDIIVGSTINTEYLENEVPAGFLIDQVRNLFVANGKPLSRELFTQKVVVELVKAGYSSLIFDFTGSWSKIISLFRGTIYENQFIYHKLGHTFVLNPLKSGIPYDKDNPAYLDYMFDAYALCFKKDDRTIDTFKNTILRNPDIDVSTLVLDLTTQRDWEKSSVTETLLSFFKEFTPQESSFIQHQQPQLYSAVQAHEFITNDKTIIIDFSELRDFDKQCFFAFVVLSKFIHYLKTGKEFTPKFIVLPHIDVVFDGYFLDKKIQYGKIDKFFAPLVKKGFGTVYSASQIRYLHPNMFNYFDNIVTFRASDKRDVAVLNGLMNLENLHGVGYYSNARNEGYQSKYIAAMKQDEAVVKREDIYQSFPVQLDFEEIKEASPLSWQELVTYMGGQGYDLETTKKKILKRTQVTLFKSDFEGFASLIEGIIKFLNNIQAVDKVGNLYKKKVKEELREVLKPYIVKITNDKKREKDIVDNVFGIMVSKQYLIENHPKRAGGSESMQTSFAVGPHYQSVLRDYYESRSASEIAYEPVELESDQKIIRQEVVGFEDIIEPKAFDPVKIRSAITEHFAPILYFEYFSMHKNMKYKKYEQVLKAARELLPKFLHAVYKEYYSVNYAITSEDIGAFISKFGSIEDFPFTGSDLRHYLSQFETIEITDQSPVSKTCETVFKTYSTIFDGFRKYTEGNWEDM